MPPPSEFVNIRKFAETLTELESGTMIAAASKTIWKAAAGVLPRIHLSLAHFVRKQRPVAAVISARGDTTVKYLVNLPPAIEKGKNQRNAQKNNRKRPSPIFRLKRSGRPIRNRTNVESDVLTAIRT